MLEQEEKFEYQDSDFRLEEYLARIQIKGGFEKHGVLVLPSQDWRQEDLIIFKPETFNFVKWVRQNKPDNNIINIAMPLETKILELRSNEFWFPLVYLFSDISLPIYLNLVSSYVYDRIKGALQNDKPSINLEIVFEEKRKKGKKKIKRFSYHGDYDKLKSIIKEIDINKLMEK